MRRKTIFIAKEKNFLGLEKKRPHFAKKRDV
jgi:hypothetical protein